MTSRYTDSPFGEELTSSPKRTPVEGEKKRKALTTQQYLASMELRKYLAGVSPSTKVMLLDNKDLTYDLVKVALSNAVPRFIPK